jgi:hypothetical protein
MKFVTINKGLIIADILVICSDKITFINKLFANGLPVPVRFIVIAAERPLKKVSRVQMMKMGE